MSTVRSKAIFSHIEINAGSHKEQICPACRVKGNFSGIRKLFIIVLLVVMVQ